MTPEVVRCRGLGVRVDSAVYQGYTIPPFYDSMVGKLIVHGKTRTECLMRLKRALDEFVVDGIETTLPLFQKLVRTQDIVDGKVFYNYGWQPFICEELSGFSVFHRDAEGRIFHTFSAFGRGAEELLGTYVLLDMTPHGRNETGPRHNLTDWVRHHDRYGRNDRVDDSGRVRPGDSETGTCCH